MPKPMEKRPGAKPNQRQIRAKIIKHLGEPKNKIDKHILNQLVELAGKKVIIQSGIHLGEKAGKLAVLLAKKQLKTNPDIGFLDFNVPMDQYSKNLISQEVGKKLTGKDNENITFFGNKLILDGMIPKGITENQLKKEYEKFIKKNLVASKNYGRFNIEKAVRHVLNPDHYIDIHGSPSDTTHIDGQPIPEKGRFFMISQTKEHAKIAREIKPDIEESPGIPSPFWGMTDADRPHFVIEVKATTSKPRAYNMKTRKHAEKPYSRNDENEDHRRIARYYDKLSGSYTKPHVLDKKSRKNAREAADFLVRYVKKLLEKE